MQAGSTACNTVIVDMWLKFSDMIHTACTVSSLCDKVLSNNSTDGFALRLGLTCQT